MEVLERLILIDFVRSAYDGWFNGVPLPNLIATIPRTLDRLKPLIEAGKINCAFERTSINPHIKRLRDLPVEKQLELLDLEDSRSICAYPARDTLEQAINRSRFDGMPFSLELALAEPQLKPIAFEMGVLDRYLHDPRYRINFYDYMGTMSITDEFFHDATTQQRDRVSLQTFGLGFDESGHPTIIVFLRYLGSLSPEHQRYWDSFRAASPAKLCPQYFEASIEGKFYENRSIRHAIFEELRLVNEIAVAVWGAPLFREVSSDDIPHELTLFPRPTLANFERFVLAMDKLLSENLNVDLLRKLVGVDREGGSLMLLETLLRRDVQWDDADHAMATIIKPLRQVRRMRQAPAHKFTPNRFSDEYYAQRKEILRNVFTSLGNIRSTLSQHPAASGISIPAWLDNGRIDVF